MVYRLVDSLEIFDKAGTVFVADITQRVPDLMHYALLHVGIRENSLDGLAYPGQVIGRNS